MYAVQRSARPRAQRLVRLSARPSKPIKPKLMAHRPPADSRSGNVPDDRAFIAAHTPDAFTIYAVCRMAD